MEQVEGSGDRAIGLEELPYEALRGIGEHEQVEAIAHEERVAPPDRSMPHVAH